MKKKANIFEMIGSELKNARTAKNLKVEDAVKDTKIRATYIKAMEAGDFDVLPAGVYTRGYIKTYSKFVGLDGEEVVRRYEKKDEEEVSEEEIEEEEEEAAVNESYKEEFSPSVLVIVASIVIAIVLYSVWYQFYDRKEVADKSSNKIIGTLSNPNPQITVLANNEAFVTILTPEKKVLFSKRMKYGDTYFIPKERKGLILKADELSNIELYLDGEPVTTLDNLEKSSGGYLLDTKRLFAGLEIR